MIAACVAERCYQVFFRDAPLAPNLYTFLLADSGVGKGNTCKQVQSFLKSRYLKARTGIEASRTTSQGIMDRMAGKSNPQFEPGGLLRYLYADREKVGKLAFVETDEEEKERLAAQHRIFLLFEELALSVGSGQRADDFIKFVTGVYSGDGFIDRTRTWGEIDIGENVCLNLLAGSTHRWLKDAVTLDAVLGGFFARCVIIDGDAEPRTRRIWRPKYAHDSDRVRAFMEQRVTELVQMYGEFVLTHEAEEIGERWYLDRPEPEDPSLGPIFRRERATVLKLAHIFALSEGRDDKKIRGQHMARAQAAIRRIGSAVIRVVAHTSITKDTRGYLELREFIKANQPVSHSACSRYMISLGCGADQFRRLLTMLRDAGELEILSGVKKGAKYYALYNKPKRLHEVDADENEENDEDEE